jgi:hypothetical protein
MRVKAITFCIGLVLSVGSQTHPGLAQSLPRCHWLPASSIASIQLFIAQRRILRDEGLDAQLNQCGGRGHRSGADGELFAYDSVGTSVRAFQKTRRSKSSP